MAVLNRALFATERYPKPVLLPDGSEITLTFQDLSVSSVRKIYRAENVDGIDVDARLIAASLVDEDGNPVMNAEKASTLKYRVSQQMVKHILNIIGVDDETSAGNG